MAQQNYRIAYLTENVTKEQLLSFVSLCAWLEVEMSFDDGDRWLIVETDNKMVYDRINALKMEHNPEFNH